MEVSDFESIFHAEFKEFFCTGSCSLVGNFLVKLRNYGKMHTIFHLTKSDGLDNQTDLSRDNQVNNLDSRRQLNRHFRQPVRLSTGSYTNKTENQIVYKPKLNIQASRQTY